MLDSLAQLRPSARTDLAGPDLAAGADVLAVLGEVGPGQLESLQARRPGGGYAILLDTTTWDPAGKIGTGPGAQAGAAALRRLGWGVAVATAGTVPSRAWDELVAAAVHRVRT
jgi:hypothetical protein